MRMMRPCESRTSNGGGSKFRRVAAKTGNSMLLPLVVVLGLVASAAAQEPILHYMFSGNAHDATGNGYDGTIYGSPAYASDSTSMGLAFYNPTGGDLATQYVALPDLTTLLGNSSYSIAVRYKTTDSSGLNGALYGNNWWNGNGLVLNINSVNRPAPNGLISQSGSSFPYGYILYGNYSSTATPRTADGSWHTAVLSVNRSAQSLDFFVDGNLVSHAFDLNFNSIPAFGTLATSFAGMTVGAAANAGYGSKATVDDFQVFNQALTQSQIGGLNFGFPTNNTPANQIRFSTAAQADAKRNQLVNWIWTGGLPTSEMPTVTKNVNVLAALDGVNPSLISSVDRLVANVGGTGFYSGSLLIHPTNRTHANKLLIVHQGHAANTMDYGVRDTVNAALAAGYTVDVMAMPLCGWNAMNNSITVDGRTLTLTSHDDIFAQLKNVGNDGLKFQLFLDPVIQNVNYWRSQAGAGAVSMTGVSGGGWTTHLAAAVDSRIKVSVPVAGSAPLYARNANGPSFTGDLEQNYAPLYGENIVDGSGGGIATWLELYTLGSYGVGRKEVMVNNKYDDICFAGDFGDTFKDIVVNKVSSLGTGYFQFYSDQHTAVYTQNTAPDSLNTTHYISADVIQNYVLANLLHLGNNSKLWVGSTEPTTSRATTSTTQAFGRVMQGSSQSASVALNSSGSDATATNASIAATGGADTTTANPIINFGGVSSVNVRLNTTATGIITGAVTLNNLATDLNDPSQGSDNGAATINITGTVLVQRGTAGSTLAATPINLGLQHTGANLSGSSYTTTVSTTGDDNQYTRVRVEGGSTAFDGTSGSGVNQTRGLAGPSNLTASSGTLANLAVNSAEDASTGDGTAYAAIPVRYTAQVFNGGGTMSQNGSWGTHANWTDSNGVHAAPGTFAGFNNVDVATLPTSRLATLNGATPSICALTLNGSVSLTQGTGGTLHLKGAAATVTVTGASNTITAPVALDSDTTFLLPNASDALGISTISGSGLAVKTGAGTLTLTGISSLSGGLTVNAGSVQITGSLASNGSSNVFIANDTNGVFGDGVGDAVLVRRIVSGASYNGYGSQMTDNGRTTTAEVIDGTAGATTDLVMAWRAPTLSEQLRGGVVSQVLGLSGVAAADSGIHNGTHQTDTFVLQMSYTPNQLPQIGSVTEPLAAANGSLYLGYLDRGPDSLAGTSDDQWRRAVEGNFGGTPNYIGDCAYSSTYGALGNFGIDTTTHVVWAVVNYNSEFAAVPEPSTFVLLLGILLFCFRKASNGR